MLRCRLYGDYHLCYLCSVLSRYYAEYKERDVMYKPLEVRIRADGTIIGYYDGIETEYSSLIDVPIADDVTVLYVIADEGIRGIDVADIIPIEDIYLRELYLDGVDVRSLDGIQYSNLRTLRIQNCTNSLDHRLDLTGCPQLRLLYIIGTAIVRLPDITACTRLNIFGAYGSDLSSDALTNLDLSALVQMQYFSIEDCRIQGVLPEYIQYWTSLIVLNLSYNVLIGSIPDSYSRLTRLRTLSLAGNGLQGDISVVTTYDELVRLHLHDTDFEDSQSLTQILNLPYIGFVSVHDSGITGRLPNRTDRRIEVSVDLDSDTYHTANPQFWRVDRIIESENRAVLLNRVFI